jgi:shikimate kinase
LLQGDNDARQVLSELFEKRDPVYREVADYVIDTDRKSMKNIVKEIIAAVESE